MRAIPAGLEVRAGDGRRVLISALARWNWRPYLGGEPPVEDIAARIAARVGAAGRPSPG